MRIFIAGSTRGPDQNIEAFQLAARMIRQAGHAPINMTEFAQCQGKTLLDDRARLNFSITMITTCDMLYLLRGWRYSSSARLLRKVARALGLKIIAQRHGELGWQTSD